MRRSGLWPTGENTVTRAQGVQLRVFAFWSYLPAYSDTRIIARQAK